MQTLVANHLENQKYSMNWNKTQAHFGSFLYLPGKVSHLENLDDNEPHTHTKTWNPSTYCPGLGPKITSHERSHHKDDLVPILEVWKDATAIATHWIDASGNWLST